MGVRSGKVGGIFNPFFDATKTKGGRRAALAQTAGIIAATRLQLPTSVTNLAANLTSRREHYASPEGDISSLVFVDVAWWMSGSYVPTATPAFTMKKFVEYPAGVFTQVTWGGNPTVTCATGAQVESDPVAITIPAGAKFWERTVNAGATITGGATIELPAGSTTLGVDDGNVVGDQGNSGTIAATSGVSTWGASAIRGTVAKAGARAFVLTGNSIVWAQGDVSSVGTKHDSGWAARWCGPLYPYVKIAKAGMSAQAFAAMVSDTKLTTFMTSLGAYSDVLYEWGINDLSLNSRTQTQLLADQQTTFGLFTGKRIYQTTLTPRSNSTDSFATVANQTAKTDGNMAALNGVNAAIRAKQTNVYGVIDIADLAMSSRDSDVWGGPFPPTADGTHPTSTKAASIAAGVALP